MSNKISKYIIYILRGDFLSRRLFFIMAGVVLAFFVIVYLSVSMDQKIYRLKQLSEEKITIQTEYVERKARVSKIQLSDELINYYLEKGFEKSDKPVVVIKVKKDF